MNGTLIAPHGGSLIERYLPDAEIARLAGNAAPIALSHDATINLANIATGGYSPRSGFMTEAEYRSVIERNKLPSGLDWTVPILLHVERAPAAGERRGLRDPAGKLVGAIEIVSMFEGAIYLTEYRPPRLLAAAARFAAECLAAVPSIVYGLFGYAFLVVFMALKVLLLAGARIVAGDVWFRGERLYAPGIDPSSVCKRIGIIHQKPIAFPMPIVENVLFGARFHSLMNGMKPHDYAELYLDRVGLLDEVKDRLGAPGHKLSGGQQQRLCLARTLANQPEVILMDEPCSAIDPAATQRIEDLIIKLKAEYTIVIVTHNTSQARRVSDHAIFMFGGRIVEAGSSERSFREPRTDLARRFISGIIG